MDDGGRFAVIWEESENGAASNLFAQLFTPGGKAKTKRIPVTKRPPRPGESPAAAWPTTAGLMVVWSRSDALHPEKNRVVPAAAAVAVMRKPLEGIHHVTAMASDPQANVDFYTGVLGLRLVKRTVNFDDPGTYHLYYGDEVGHPGTILTYLPVAWAPGGESTAPDRRR